jgi:hypothetical protein
MADPEGLSPQNWTLDDILAEGPPLIVAQRPSDAACDAFDDDPEQTDVGDDSTQDLDQRVSPAHDGDSGAPDPRHAHTTDVNAAAKRTLAWMASGVALVAVLIVVTFLAFGGGAAPAAPPHQAVATQAVVAVPTAPTLPAPQHEQAVPFDPTTDSCPGGSTSPLALTDNTADSAWVCSRGPQESQLDGQILHLKFLCGRSRPDTPCSYMVTALAATPGWVAKTPGGQDEWLQHRCVTRLQFNFYNGDRLAADPFFLDTNCVHGPVPATLPGRILASRVDVLILHTERPPAAPPPGTTPAADGVAPPPGLVDSVVGTGEPAAPASGTEPTVADANTDPVDATVAISQLRFSGHLPN